MATESATVLITSSFGSTSDGIDGPVANINDHADDTGTSPQTDNKGHNDHTHTNPQTNINCHTDATDTSPQTNIDGHTDATGTSPHTNIDGHTDATGTSATTNDTAATTVNKHKEQPNTVTITYYGTIPQFVYEVQKHGFLSVENIFKAATEHLRTEMRILCPHSDNNLNQDGFLPATLPLFGLVDQKSSNWLSSTLTLSSTFKSFYYRFRYRLYEDSNFVELFRMDSYASKYLFIQCRDDFINNRIPRLYDENVRDKMLGFVVMDLLIPKHSYCHRTVRNLSGRTPQSFDPVANFAVSSLLKKLPKKSRRQFMLPWVYMMLYLNLRRKLTQSNKDLKPEIYQRKYIQAIFHEVTDYCLETYTGTVNNVNQEEQVTIGINPYLVTGDFLFFDKRPILTLDKLFDIKLKFESSEVYEPTVKITIIQTERKPEMVTCALKDGLSLVSCLNGYYRLMVNYSTNICAQETTKICSLLTDLHSFGPMLYQDAETCLIDKLEYFQKTNMAVRSVFLIRQRLHLQDSFQLITYNINEEKHYYYIFFNGSEYIVQSGDKKVQTASDKKFQTSSDVLDHFKVIYKRQIKPSTDKELNCKVWIKGLFHKNQIEDYGLEGGGFGSQVTKSKPGYISEDAIIHNGEKQTGDLCLQRYKVSTNSTDEPLMAIELKTSIPLVPKPEVTDLFELSEFLHKVPNKSFVRFIGLSESMPLRLFINYPPYGNLLTFMKKVFKDPSQTECSDETREDLNLLQIVNTAASIAAGLQFLKDKNIIHGDLRCENIHVYGLTNAQIDVRIADPGLVKFCNKQDISFNYNRLEWIAVELFDNLSLGNIESEIYSYATLLWQFLSFGKKPRDALNIADNGRLMKYFKQGGVLPKPQILDRNLSDFDHKNDIRDNLWKLILECWRVNPGDRPDISVIIPKLATESNNIGEFEEKNINLDKKVVSEPVVLSGNCINKNQLDLTEIKLGEGHYGYVIRGKYNPCGTRSPNSSHSIEVAIKQLKDLSIKDKAEQDLTKKMFSDEVSIMEKLEHKNVVKIIGVCHDVTMMLVMEYIECGSLENYLKKSSQKATYEQYYQFSTEIAEGMKYLSSQRVLHRDLAARNILLTNCLSVKITDFGLAKQLEGQKDYYRMNPKKCLPMHWTAPEGFLQRVFSSKSDVWSYGIVLWEIYSNGKTPILIEKGDQVMFINGLKNNKRLVKDKSWPEKIRNLMDKCWEFEKEKRPNFEDIVSKLSSTSTA